MGVYNPNMEMPRNCTECLEFKDDCEHYWDYYCTHELRPNDCPLIEIDLIRCKDYKHYDTESRTFPCCTDIFGAVRYMEADGFCSKGERRSE